MSNIHQLNDINNDINSDINNDINNKDDNKEIFKTSPKFQEMEKLLTCQSCQQIFMNPITLFCQHTFCQSCLLLKEGNDLKCFTCHSNVIIPPINNFQLKNIIDKIYPEAYFKERKQEFDKQLSNDLQLKRKYEIYKELFNNNINKINEVCTTNGLEFVISSFNNNNNIFWG